MSDEHELHRVTKLASGLFEKIEAATAAREGVTNVRYDQLAIIGIVSFTDEDGDDCEMPVFRFETARFHVQQGIVGIVMDALRARMTG